MPRIWRRGSKRGVFLAYSRLQPARGSFTRALASALPESVSIIATDLNQAMLDQAAAVGTKRAVEWRQADAVHLPFDDATFDAVVCQFGAMFFPDQAKAVVRGASRAQVGIRAHRDDRARVRVPKDPPRFMARTPHGYHDRSQIARHLAQGGFTTSPRIDTVAQRSRAKSPREPVIAYCQGTPLRSEIEARDAARLGEATDVAAEPIAKRFGRGPVEGKIQAHVVTVGVGN
jgi:SAM-dependent methyltransferase